MTLKKVYYTLFPDKANTVLIKLLNTVKSKFTDSSDLTWTSYATAKEVRDKLDLYIEKLTTGDKNCLDDLFVHFLPTCDFQEHSFQNGWPAEYLEIASKFDTIYAVLKKE